MPVSIKGKIYDIPGVGEVRLYPISKLSEAFKEAGIPRDQQTIRYWISKGILPRSMFQVGTKKPHGLYSEHHIKTIVSVAKDCGIKQGTSFRESNFQEKVWDAIKDKKKIFMRRMK